ncbi:hypothetical protein PK98_03020 [Croceibacterium mercuriale]|uniref:Glycosyltransferase 2-like domain-containing protein n=2 Tax=Croceibacterium mercuriale TaxID=1572751 RepID=A0A0B2C0Z4_9SPHN|nr:hypothetical protein PK98_03020 [Croceibacterium mercuriale]
MPFDMDGDAYAAQESRAAQALEQTLLSLRLSARPPREVIVAVTGEARLRLPQASFPIRQLRLPEGTGPMVVRNTLTHEAQGELLVFLDPQCMATTTMMDDYAAAAQRQRGIMAGGIGFLPPAAQQPEKRGPHLPMVPDLVALADDAQTHPDRPVPSAGLVPADGTATGLWGANWAIRVADLQALGGFDEAYRTLSVGEADLARRAAARGMPPRWIEGAVALHQYRARPLPPLEQLDALLADAAQFHVTWNQPAPERWLRAFALMGLIAPCRRGDGSSGAWRKLREPTDADHEMTNPPEGQVWPGSNHLVDWLEDRAVVRLDSRGGRPGAGSAA